ncbi:MAG: hypothetical protein ACLUG4_08240 [Bacilli bacterium]
MNNNYEEFKEAVKSFSNWLDSIPPYEYSLTGVIIAYIIAPNLTNSAQNAFGNWLELVGQIILTISAQASATPETGQYNQLLADVENLKAEIERLKNRN